MTAAVLSVATPFVFGRRGMFLRAGVSMPPTLAWVASAVRRVRAVASSPVGDLSDGELLRRIGGDQAALRELIMRHQVSLRRLARSMMHNEADADEVVQDSFLAAHRHAGSFRGDATVKSWLHAICYRQCLGRLRRVRPELVPLDPSRHADTSEFDPVFEIVLEEAVRSLPEANRAAFVLVDVLGFTREDAARVVDAASNTMRARVARARTLLADHFSAVSEAQP